MKIIQQVSVFVENRPGALQEILQIIRDQGMSLKALSVADTAEFGILRCIVAQPERLEEILRQEGMTVKLTPVLAIRIEDEPGALLEYTSILSSNGINIEYVYAFATALDDVARVVLKVDDPERAMTLCGQPQRQAQETELPGFREGPDLFW